MNGEYVDISGFSEEDLKKAKDGCMVGCLSEEAQQSICAQLDIKDASQLIIPCMRDVKPNIKLSYFSCP